MLKVSLMNAARFLLIGAPRAGSELDLRRRLTAKRLAALKKNADRAALSSS